LALFSLSLGGVVGLVAGAALPWLLFLALAVLGTILAFFLRRRRGLLLAALALMALGLGGPAGEVPPSNRERPRPICGPGGGPGGGSG